MRATVLLVALLCAAAGAAQPVTDPKLAASVVQPKYLPADVKELAALDEPGYPTWSPDGRFIAFSSYRSGSANVWITDVATKQWRPSA